jgi:hypothetical protein
MKKHFVVIVFAIISGLFINVSYGQHDTGEASEVKLAVIREVVQTTNYTYLHVKVDTGMQWLAVPSIKITAGDTCYYKGGLVMPDFTSKELKMTFRQVIFLERVSKTPETAKMAAKGVPEHGTKPKAEKLAVKVDRAPGGITIAELFENKENYNGKVVKIRGEVIKFKAGIMGKNWAHLQDGTAFGDKFDLTVTLSDTLTAGDIVTLESKVTLNKDFGSGYFFDVIMEDALVR